MTLLALDASAVVSTGLPVVASTALRELLLGPPTEGEVLGAAGKAIWVDVGGECVMVEAAEGARLPNAVTVAGELPRPEAGERVDVGDGRIVLAGAILSIVRWFDPVPKLGAIPLEHLQHRVAGIADVVVGPPDEGLAEALAGRNGEEVLAAAHRLLGKGDGLTPVGDDLLAGALAATVLLGRAIGELADPALVDGIAIRLDVLARRRTTALSATLLRHACSGRVAGPVAALLTALAGRGRIDEELRSVVALGHSSGEALAAGTLIGARALIGGWA